MAELDFSMMMKKKDFYQACRESESKGLYPIVILALSTGMRRGEIMNLKWSDVDLDSRFYPFTNHKEWRATFYPSCWNSSRSFAFKIRQSNR